MAIQWVINQQKFHNALSARRAKSEFVFTTIPFITEVAHAGKFWYSLDFYKTHPTVSNDRQIFVITKLEYICHVHQPHQ